jgi:hypothetical protein
MVSDLRGTSVVCQNLSHLFSLCSKRPSSKVVNYGTSMNEREVLRLRDSQARAIPYNTA